MLLPTLFNMRTMLPRRAGVATASAATTVKMPAGLVVNKLEPGIFEKDKGSKGTRKSTRVRTKRA